MERKNAIFTVHCRASSQSQNTVSLEFVMGAAAQIIYVQNDTNMLLNNCKSVTTHCI